MIKGLKVSFVLLIALGWMLACGTPGSKRDVPVVNGVVHVVQEGETINAIAKTYEVSSQLLVRRNNFREGDILRPGTRLFIPGAEELRTVNTAEADATIREEKDGLFHRVGKGETLVAIANAYNLSLDELQRVNNLPDPSRIYVNQELWIPRAKEVQDIVIPKVTIVSAAPLKSTDDDPRVVSKVNPTPTPTNASTAQAKGNDATKNPSATEKPTPTPTPVDFPRKVKEFGPVKFQWPLKGSFKFLRGFSKSAGNPTGIDLGADIGTDVCAAADGEVLVVGGASDSLGMNLGNYIILYHGDRNNKEIYTLYAHNSQCLVKIGEQVKRGQAIAKVGRTGRPFSEEGGILHFEVRELMDSIDPLTVLPPLN